MNSTNPYIGHCSNCGDLRELDTSTALCAKCSPADVFPELTETVTKKEGKNGG